MAFRLDGGDGMAGSAPRLTLFVVTVVFVNFGVNALQYVVAERATIGYVGPAVLFLTVMMGLQLGFFSRPGADLRSRAGYAALLVQAVVVLVPIAYYGEGWTGLQGFLAGNVLLVLRPLAGWSVFVALALLNGFGQYLISGTSLAAGYITNLTAVVGLVVYGLSRLRSLVRELHDTRAVLAGLAVARERLRFADDLHDLLGSALSAITLKIELAQRRIPRQPDGARRELTEILAISRQALADARAVASSYRELSLDDDVAVGGTRRGFRGRGPALVPRLGLAVAAAVFAGYAVNAVIFVMEADLGRGGTLVAVLCVLVSLGVVLGFFSRPSSRVRSPRGYALLAVLALVTYLPVVLFENAFLGLPGLLAGSLLLAVPGRRGIPLLLIVAVLAGGIHVLLGGDSISIGWGFLVTVNQGLVVFALSRLRAMVQDLVDARAELAELAVTRERLRFARDLHDLLGFSLSAITLKSEVAHRLVAPDPARARHELAEILLISRQALVDVRAVTSHYRELSLDEETRSATAVLAAANVKVTLRLEPCELATDVRTTFATVLREGVTNLLRHSSAENCEITISCRDELLTLEIVNDGLAPADGGAAAGAGEHLGGWGIHNLNARVADLGGTLSAGTTADDTYRLRAAIPRAHA